MEEMLQEGTLEEVEEGFEEAISFVPNVEKKPLPSYDKMRAFQEECNVHIAKLKQYCHMNDIPFYMTFACKETGKDTTYYTSKLFPPECGVALSKDRFRNLILAEQGFELAMDHLDSFDF
jgi:hypothetical protein